MRRGMRHVHTGSSFTGVLIAGSIAAGIALAITCSYRPIALWWVMAGCSAVNVLRFGARRMGIARAAGAPADPRIAWLKQRLPRRLAADDERTAARASKASLDRQNRRFLIWFTEHNLLWTTIGFGGSLLLWHRFGPMTSALVVMAALMSCGVLAASGALVGARTRGLGLCWREPCRTPDFRSLARLVDDVGTVLVLRNRHEFAAARDWAKGGRFHELFLAIDDLDRAGVEPGLAATLHDGGDAARRALAKKERFDRALALAPVFVAAVIAAALFVPPFAGSEPLPSLWDIVARSAGARSSSATGGDDDGTPQSIASPDRTAAGARAGQPKQAPADGSARDTSNAAGTPPAATSATGDQSTAAAGGEATGSGSASNAPGAGAGQSVAADGQGNGAARGGNGAGAGSGQGAGGQPIASNSPGEGKSEGPGGRGGGPHGYGTSGPAPERAESPAAVPEIAPNPGDAIEVVLPPFSQAKAQAPGDEPGDKRKNGSPVTSPSYQPQRDAVQSPHEATAREPVQRWPNWVFRLLHKSQDR